MAIHQPSVPIGTIIDYAGSTLPDGYLECDGSAVSRTTYASLFAAIGTTWGTGDGSTTFNLPDLRGRTAIGAGTGTAGGATAHSLGSKGGDERLQSHTHNVSCGWQDSAGVDRLAFGQKAGSYNARGLGNVDFIQSAGGGSQGNMQPFATVKKAIRAA